MFNKNTFEEYRNQYFGTICGNAIAILYGLSLGWASPSILFLTSDESPLASGPLTLEQASWVAAFIPLGNIVGNFLLLPISEYLGRRNTILVLVIPYTICWCLIYFTNSIEALLVARFLAGVHGGGIVGVLPLYIAEIASKEVRGTLTSYLLFSTSVGQLMTFIMGTFINYYTVALICIPLCILVSVGFACFPETPHSLMRRKKPEAAENSLLFYRNIHKETKDERKLLAAKEMEEIVNMFDKTASTDKKASYKDIFERQARNTILLGVFVMMLSQFSGCSSILTYTATIFKQTGTNMDPFVSSILAALAQTVGVIFAANLVERTGRKLLILVSCIGGAFFLILTALFSWASQAGYDLTYVNWIPIISLPSFVFIISSGIIPLCFVVIVEILPTKIRTIGSTICIFTRFVGTFITYKTVPYFTELLELHGLLLMFAGFCTIGFIVLAIYLPETRGKNLNLDETNAPNTSNEVDRGLSESRSTTREIL